MFTTRLRWCMVAALLALCGGVSAQVAPARLECGFDEVSRGAAGLLARIRSGEISRPAPPPVAPRSENAPRAPGVVDVDDLMPYEDSAGLLLSAYSTADLLALMVDAANALLVERGDNFDFVGYWLNFEPSFKIGAAFYKQIENDVTGIGEVGVNLGEPPLFNLRSALGLAGDQLEGFVMMWNINSAHWAPGTGPDADFTRLALGQEFEHRFAMFLTPLLDGRVLQGDNASCGRTLHWGWQVDGQGSCMEISEWVGAAPASLAGSFVTFNTDIPGSVFSYSDLYLMGYVTAAEMDAGNSELRFMDSSACGPTYFGPVSTFTSADIVASAGPRVPDAAAEDHDYRTGWIMLHLPGAEPSPAQLAKAAGILNQHTADWSFSTLGRGTMDNTLPPASRFVSVGGGLAGAHGVPSLVGGGSLVGGTPVSLALAGALENAATVLVVGLSELSAPFKGGVMVPALDVVLTGLVTDGAGQLVLSGSWPPGVPSGLTTFLQHWVTDGAGPAGFAASNALVGVAP